MHCSRREHACRVCQCMMFHRTVPDGMRSCLHQAYLDHAANIVSWLPMSGMVSAMEPQHQATHVPQPPTALSESRRPESCTNT